MSGDYISREAALQAMWNALYALEDRQEAESGLDIMRRADVQAGFEAGQQVVAKFPAADVVEVVHARPIKFYCDARTGRMMTTCSACDMKIGPYDSFCKHCGAKMDGGQDDGTA